MEFCLSKGIEDQDEHRGPVVIAASKRWFLPCAVVITIYFYCGYDVAGCDGAVLTDLVTQLLDYRNRESPASGLRSLPLVNALGVLLSTVYPLYWDLFYTF
jgi:hypothetical protein